MEGKVERSAVLVRFMALVLARAHRDFLTLEDATSKQNFGIPVYCALFIHNHLVNKQKKQQKRQIIERAFIARSIREKLA